MTKKSENESNKTALPKLKLIEFLKNSIDEEEYRLVAPVPVNLADAFVHRMRVELSRFRAIARDRNRVPKQFKVLYLQEKTEKIDNESCAIYLKKSKSGHAVDQFIDDIFDEIAGGKILNV